MYTNDTPTALGVKTKKVTSSIPGWPPHSNPTMITASTPACSAFLAKRTAGTLWKSWTNLQMYTSYTDGKVKMFTLDTKQGLYAHYRF